MKRAVSPFLVAMFCLFPGAASAETLTLDSVPIGTDTFARAEGKFESPAVRTVEYAGDKSFITDLAAPVCLGTSELSFVSGLWMSYGTEEFVVSRIVTRGAPALERTRVRRDGETLTSTGVARIPLAEVAERGGVKAYAYRTDTQLRLLVPRGFSAVMGDIFDPRSTWRACGYQVIAIGLAGGASAAFVVPPTALPDATRWMSPESMNDAAIPHGAFVAIHASLSKVARDPSPVVSITMTTRE